MHDRIEVCAWVWRERDSGDGTATATAAMAAPLFTAEINNSLVINYNCNLDRVSAAGVQSPLIVSI